MSEINIVDDILAPSEVITMNFRGQYPFKVVTMVPMMLRDVMKISGVDIFERDIRWDFNVDPRDFYGYWVGRRSEDRWTTTFVLVIIQGAQASKDKTGWVNIRIKGTVQTHYQYSNFLQKSFWWFYNLMFYYKQRRQYIEWSKDNIYKMREVLTKALGIPREE